MTEGKTFQIGRFSTPTEAILYVAERNLSRVEADPIFDANEIDRDDAWALVEKARADAKSRELGKQGRGVPETDFATALDRAVAKAKAKPALAEAVPAVGSFRPSFLRRAEQPPTAAISELLKELPSEEVEAKVEVKLEPKAKVEAKPKPAVDIPPAPLPPPGATEAEAITYPRGLLGHIVQYIVDTAELPDRQMALCGAVLVCALALARKVLGPNDVSSTLYAVLIGETGAGKQHIINCIKLLLRAIGMPDVCVGSSMASLQAIEEVLQGIPPHQDGKPTALIIADEYGSVLRRISHKSQGANTSEIPATLQTLWAWPPQVDWNGAIKLRKNNIPVWGPALMIFGASTEGDFFTALKSKEVASGFVNRHLLFNVGRGATKRRPKSALKYQQTQCPVWLIEAFKKIAGEPAPVDNRPIERTDNRGKPTGIFLRDWRRVGFDEGAEEAWLNFENEEIRNLPSVEELRLWIRAPEIALRLAFIVAAFRGSTLVDTEDFAWGKAVSQQSGAAIAQGLQEHMIEEFEQADLVKLLRDEFRNKTVLRIGQIHRFFERKCGDYRKIDRAIQHLLTTKEIHSVPGKGGAGRPTDRYRWTAADRKGI